VLASKFARRMALLGTAILLIGSLAFLPDRSFRRSENARQWVEHTLLVLNVSEHFLSSMESAETSERGYLLTSDKLYLEPFQSAIANQLQARLKLRQLTADNDSQQTRTATLNLLAETRVAQFNSVIGLFAAEGLKAAAAAVAGREGNQIMQKMRNLIFGIQAEEYRLLSIRTKAAESQAESLQWNLRGGGILLVGLLFAFGIVSERDIGAHRRAEESLKNSEERFHTLADAIPQLCWMANADGGIFWYNQRWYEFTGTNLQAMEGWGWQSVHDPEVLPMVMKGWTGAIARGEPFEMVFPLRAAGGKFHHFLTRVMPVRAAGGAVTRWFGTNTDISDQRMVEDSLREHKDLLRLAQEVGKIGTFDWNVLNGILTQTSEMDMMYGLAPGTLGKSGKTLLDMISADDREAVRRQLHDGIESGSFEAEWRILWPDGSEHWQFARARILRDETGSPVRSIGAIVDVTERKRAELEVIRMNSQLEERILFRTIELEASNKELAAFAYSVSHDLRAPLRGIDGWSLALLDDYGAQLDHQALEYLTRVRSETQRMGNLIDHMLLLSRVTRDDIRRVPVDLTALAHQISTKLLEDDPERLAEFVIAPQLAVVGDVRLLNIALTNLFSNALKFTGKQPKARIEFGKLEKDAVTVFYIRDNGVGFNMAHARNLFGAFQRLHKTSEFPGTGIGLAIVQRVIERHGGRVWAESLVNSGATFSFTLGVRA
jgi:PAS domain S-box-containing protein